MGAFEYTALDAGGKERRGVLEGDTPRHVRQLLRERQLLPVKVAEVERASESRAARLLAVGGGISASDLALLTRQLATLVTRRPAARGGAARGVEQTEKPRVQSIMLGVRAKVHGGPHAGRRPRRISRASSRRSTARPCRPASRPASSTPCSSAWRTTPRTARSLRQKVLGAMLYPIVLTVHVLSSSSSMMLVVRGAEGRRGVRDEQAHSCRWSRAS